MPHNYLVIVNFLHSMVLVYHNISEIISIGDFGKVPNIRPINYDDEVLKYVNIQKLINISNLKLILLILMIN